MSLHVHRGHRLEALAAALATVTRSPLRSVLAAEIVVVQSLGMRRWLSLELAQRHGVAMNVRFPFPAGFAHEVFSAAFPGEQSDAGFHRDLLPWRILGLISQLQSQPGWEELRGYVEGENGALKSYQLALRIAAIFDRYLAYRPELLLEWQTSRTSDWQAQLWRALVKGRKAQHPPALLRRLQESVEERKAGEGPGPLLQALPERVSVFGISSLPPLYLHLIEIVSRCLEVHLFLFEPTDQYWGDIQSRREQDRILRDRPETADELHLDGGNPLLASLGKIGRDFTRLVQDLEPASIAEHFTAESPPTLLGKIQSDIFALRERTPDEREPIAGSDFSLQLHCCHGPMREVEVLHDQLLDLFDRMRDLTPRDVLVAMPDVESYAPFIEAVFGSPESEAHAIPFTIADRSARAESSAADAFLRLLDLQGSRFGAATVLGLLESAVIRRRFDLGENDLETIRGWVARTGIRWGIDETHRTSLGLPGTRENTWRAGLDRLLLGYALPGDGRSLFEGILPVPEMEGPLALTLGRFVEFAEALFARIPPLAAPRALPQWEHTFRDLLRTFFDESDESADEVRRLREVIGQLGETALAADFGEAVAFEVIRAHLATALADTDSGIGFLAGCVTFCALKPMRAIPFKVICLLGMNDTAFPRRDPALAFDLISSGGPRRGDRSLRDDDRYLFLEAILSARHTLYLSYSGLSPRDNSEASPSVVISELTDYVAQNYLLAKPLVTRHQLQPFSPAYFDGSSRLFSYSAENARTSERSREPRIAAAAFGGTLLPEPGPEWNAVDLDRLAEFFANPAKFFARERLRLALPDETEPLEESEPLSVGALERYQLRSELTASALGGAPAADHLAVARAAGNLPHGYAGDSEFRAIERDAAAMADRIRAASPGTALEPQRLDTTIGDWRLTGTMHGLHTNALLRHRAANLKGKDVVRAWIYHLALQLGDGPRETLLLALDTVWHFAPVAGAPTVLAELLAHYREGLRAPLPFFPNTSMEFARRALLPSNREKTDPVNAARGKWEGSEYFKGTAERDDPWFALCFPSDTDPLDEHWQNLATRFFGPIFEARKEDVS